MQQSLTFFNWSVNRLLSTEADLLSRARIKILFMILVFAIVKVVTVIPLMIVQQQDFFQLARAAVLLVVYVVLFKLLRAGKRYVAGITHIMAWMGILLIWSNIFVTSQNINILTLQFLFMLVLSSFYLLNKGFGIAYSALGMLPVALYLVFPGQVTITDRAPQQLLSPGFEILVILNFATIVVAHYLFSNAFTSTIAAKERLNAQLQYAVKEANNASESKSEFLSTMSHELRTPLNAVLGISELLMKDSHNREQQENLEVLKYAAENLHALINDVLDFNKLESGKLELETITTDLAEIITNTGSALGFQASQKGIDLILDIDEMLAGNKVITDPTRISQIINNLAGNAIKFTEKGSVTIALKTLGTDSENIQVRFAVKDTGIGISREQQEKIFEPFTQASASTTRKFGGTGLGLAIVKQLLIMFSSSIQLESIPGEGSTFYFDISFRLDNEQEAPKTAEMQAEHDLSGIRILVAEDNAMNRLLLTKIFSKWNNTPVFATNGQEAVDKLMQDNFDVVLMDVHMPVMNGYEATQAIRAMEVPAKSNIPVIAITAAVDNNLRDKITLAGMNDFILKPFKINELYSKLESVVLTVS